MEEKPSEVVWLRHVLELMEGHLPGCSIFASPAYGEDDCSCQRAERRAAIAALVVPPPDMDPVTEAADVERREARQDRYAAIYYGHIPVEGDAALLLDHVRELGRAWRRLNEEQNRLMQLLQLQKRQIAKLQHDLEGTR